MEVGLPISWMRMLFLDSILHPVWATPPSISRGRAQGSQLLNVLISHGICFVFKVAMLTGVTLIWIPMLSGGNCFQCGKSLANGDPESVKQKNSRLTVAMSY